MSLPEDQELIAKITAGDTEALAGYLQSHRERILGFIRAITSTRLLSVVELDNLFQEVLIAIISLRSGEMLGSGSRYMHRTTAVEKWDSNSCWRPA